MTSYELTKHLQALLEATGPDRALVRYLFVLAKGYEAVASELMEVLQAKSRTLFSVKQQSSQDKFAELRRQADTFPFGQIFHETIELQTILKRALDAFEGDEAHFFNEMNRSVSSFYAEFERLIRSPSKEAFVTLLPEAGHLYAIIVSSRQFFTTVRHALRLKDQGTPGMERLSIVFENTNEYGGIIKKLTALETGYTELCGVAGVSKEDYPLRVIKIEAGNLWVCVEGERRVMGLLIALIQRFALFWYHRVGTGEADTSSSDRVTATQSLVNLADELERAGIMQVSTDAAQIRDLALQLRRVFVDLLENEPAVRVNERLYSVDSAPSPQYIAETKPITTSPPPAGPKPVDIHRLAKEIALAAGR